MPILEPDVLMTKLQAVFGNSLNRMLPAMPDKFVTELRALDQKALLDVYRSFDTVNQ